MNKILKINLKKNQIKDKRNFGNFKIFEELNCCSHFLWEKNILN